MSDIVFEEPPKVTRGPGAGRPGGVWKERLAPLRDNPDQWARVAGPTKSPSSTANSIKNSLGDEYDDFQLVSRNLTDENGEDQGYVYARFMSEETKQDVLPKRKAREQAAQERASKRKGSKSKG